MAPVRTAADSLLILGDSVILSEAKGFFPLLRLWFYRNNAHAVAFYNAHPFLLGRHNVDSLA